MYKNFNFKIYKIKENFLIKKKYDYEYIKKYLENKENVIYNYELYYNKRYKKFFYYDNKRKKYNNKYYVLKYSTNNKYLLKEIKFNSLFKYNKLLFIENYIKKNFNYLRKYNLIKIDNELYIIYKKLIL